MSNDHEFLADDGLRVMGKVQNAGGTVGTGAPSKRSDPAAPPPPYKRVDPAY